MDRVGSRPGVRCLKLAAIGYRRQLSVALLIGAAIAVGIAISPLGNIVQSRVGSEHSSNSSRASLYQQSFTGVARSPLLGYGSPQPSTSGGTGHAHVGTQGQFYLILVSHGIPGLVFYLGWFAFTFLHALRRRTVEEVLWSQCSGHLLRGDDGLRLPAADDLRGHGCLRTAVANPHAPAPTGAPGGPGVPAARGGAVTIHHAVDRQVVHAGRSHARTPVLFIGGLGRSGSTLLDLLLAGVPGMVPVGELRHLWTRGLRDDDRCACGARFSACPFWNAVGDHSFGGWTNVDADRTIALARRVDRHRRLMTTAPAWREPSHELRRYGEMLEQLFAGILAVSGGEVVIDSSKDPPHGFVLRRTPGIDLRIVHLVRDSRGVAESWGKALSRPDAVGGPAMMTRLAPWRTAMMWVDTNLLVEALGHGTVPSVRLRYRGPRQPTRRRRPPHRQVRRGRRSG